MLLGCIADDFTGAGDLGNTLAKGGMRTRIFVGIPAGNVRACDAGVIALKSRSVPASDAVAQSLAALDSLREAGCTQFLFKYCSTFDSTPLGNIGPVAVALARALDAHGVVVCPAFPATGRTVYEGHLFVGDRLLSQSGMERHPLTPMSDPDIRRWLASQCTDPPGHIAHHVVRRGTDAIAAALEEHARTGTTLVVVDAISEEDLIAIAEAAADAKLLTGASGIAVGLPEIYRRSGLISHRPSGFRANSGDAVAFAGSCSAATSEQVDVHSRDHPALALDPARLLAGEPVQAEARAFLQVHRADIPLIYSSAEPQKISLEQAPDSGSGAAAAIEAFFGEMADYAASSGFGRLVVAGGETSGAAVTSLGVETLEIGPEIDPGVPAMSTVDAGGRTLALALKSGNFGSRDFFAKAVRCLGEAHE